MNRMYIETRSVDIKIGWKAKQELIRSIQEKQGMTRCFQTGKEYCLIAVGATTASRAG